MFPGVATVELESPADRAAHFRAVKPSSREEGNRVMSLQQRLDRIREGFERQAPAAALSVMHRATDDLRTSGILDGVVGEGRQAPDFTLTDSRGESVQLHAQLQRGPTILSFFRGDW